MGRLWLVVVFLVGLAAPAPELVDPVTDHAHVLSSEAVATLGQKLRSHRQEHGIQMAVLVIDSTGAEPIEDYGIRVATKWGGGSEERDDGVLFILAVKDRRMRLELGYGVEAWIPDATAKQVLATAVPHLRREDYDSAATAVVDGVIGLTSGAPPPEVLHPTRSSTGIRVGIYVAIFFVCGVVGRLFRQRADDAKAAEHGEAARDSPIDPELGMAGAWIGLLVVLLGSVAGLLGFGWGHYCAALLGGYAGWKFLFRDAFGTLFNVGLIAAIGGVTLFVCGGLFPDEPAISYAASFAAQAFVTWMSTQPGGGSSGSSYSSTHSSDSAGSFGSFGSSWGSGSSSGGGSSSGWSSGGSSGGSFGGGGGSFGGGGASSSW